MINDVSKIINNNNNNSNNSSKYEKYCTMSRTQSLTGANDFDAECSGDFPIKVTYTGNNKNDNNNDNITMIADASKMRNITKTIKTTTTTPTSATKTTTIKEKNQRHQEIKGETIQPTTTRQLTTMSRKKISPVSTTPSPTHTKRMEAKNRTTTIATTTTTTMNVIPIAKKPLTLRKNKCPASESHKISSQRALKASTSRTVSPIYGRINSSTATTTTFTYKCSKPKSIQCEPLESTGSKQSTPESIYLPAIEKEIRIQAKPALSLAEQKAQLRSDFFKDIKLDQPEFSSRVDTTTEFSSVPAKEQQQQQQQHEKQEQQQNQLARRLLKRCSKLKLKTSPILVPETTNAEYPAEFTEDIKTVLVPITHQAAEKLSLIDQRKLELKRKFASQTAVKITRSKQNPLFEFRRVAQLVKKFDQLHSKMIVNPNKVLEVPEQTMLTLKPDVQDQRHSSPLSDEGCNLGQSPYSTDDEQDNDDNVSIRTASTMIEIARSSKRKDKVARSASSDSALGLEVDDPMDASTTSSANAVTASTTSAPVTPSIEQQQKRRMTLTVTDLPLRPALLPLAEPTTLPDSPTPEIQHTLQNLLAQTTVPSKVLLEERVVEIPEEPSLRSTCPTHVSSHVTSRRESEQSCISDYLFSESGGVPGIRYVRTPSVVVSDYSDDVMCGITLEEIEYFRAQRLRRRSSLDAAGIDRDAETQSDVSASSSCSNLYYCGSTISALDGAECLVNGRRVQLERKTSDCSTCSASNEDETTSTSSSAFTLTEDSCGRDIADLLAAQHLCSKRAKKVGGATDSTDLSTCLNISDKRMV